MEKNFKKNNNYIENYYPQNVDTTIQMSQLHNVNFDEKIIQKAFIRKVLFILLIQFSIVTFLVLLAVFSQEYRDFQIKYIVLVIIASLIEIAFFIALQCFRNNVKVVPRNYILLFVFTICSSYIVSFIAGIVAPVAVLSATIATIALCGGLILYSLITKKDFTYLSAIFIWAPIALIFIIIIASMFRSYLLRVIIAMIIIGLFSLYLVYDIQRLTGKFGTFYTYDEYILAALDIFVDVIVIFKELLLLMSR